MGYKLYTHKNYIKDSNIVILLKTLKENLISIYEENKDLYKIFQIKNIGRFIEVNAFYHEENKYYNCIGFEVEIETQFDFEETPRIEIGFYSVWKGKSHSCAPFTFENGNISKLGESYRFDNGYGDKAEVTKELISEKEIQKIVSDNNINFEIK